MRQNQKGRHHLIGASNRYDGLENLKTVEAFAAMITGNPDLYPAFKV